MVQNINELRQDTSEKVVIRLSLGLLDASSIIHDLEQALHSIGACHA